MAENAGKQLAVQFGPFSLLLSLFHYPVSHMPWTARSNPTWLVNNEGIEL